MKKAFLINVLAPAKEPDPRLSKSRGKALMAIALYPAARNFNS
ncbi:hypothetical protein [Ensifer adhaerens]|nr:hypothetical protein [Ensifer adhaerens]